MAIFPGLLCYAALGGSKIAMAFIFFIALSFLQLYV